MAANIFTGATNSNSNTASNWSLGVVPLIGDGNIATWDATSPACTINAALNCNGADFTGYTANLNTSTNTITCNGNLILGSGMTFTGTGAFLFSANASATFNGKQWPGIFGCTSHTSGASTMVITLLDAGACAGNLQISSSVSGADAIWNGFSMTVSGGMTVFGNGNRTFSGTTNIIMIGTGTLTCGVNSHISNNLTFNTAGTLTISGNWYYRGGTLTYTAGTMVVTGSSLNCASSVTLNTSGMTWAAVTFSGTSQTVTLTSNLNLTGTLTFNGATTTAVNGLYNINAAGGVTINSAAYVVSGSATLVLTGTGTWTHTSTSSMGLNVTVNTAGTITFNSNGFRCSSNGTFLYVAGTLTGTLNILCTSYQFNCSAVTWGSLTTQSGTLTLLADMYVTSIAVQTNAQVFNGAYNLYNSGSLTRSTSGIVSGTSTIVLTGSGVWSDSFSTIQWSVNLTINASGTYVLGSSLSYRGGTLKYIAGTLDIVTNSTALSISGSTTLDTNIIQWAVVNFNAAGTRTLLSDFKCDTLNVTSGASVTNGFNLYTKNLIYNTTTGSQGSGTTKFILNGTGTWSHATTGRFSNDLTIDAGAGTVTIGSSVYYQTGTLTYLSGTVNTSGGTLNFAGSCTVLTGGMVWNSILLNSVTLTLNETLYANQITPNTSITTTFSGTNGFVVTNFNINTAGNTLTFANGIIYLVNGNLVSAGSSGSQNTFTCASGAALLKLAYTATQNLTYTNATRINSSGGQPIYTSSGTLVSTTNWGIGSASVANMFLTQ